MKKKKVIILLLITIVIIGGISFKLINKPKELEKPKEGKKDTLAMYLEDESGTFQISNSKTFPKEGYVLDHYICKNNGGTITQDPETKKISASFSKGDSCNLYFAKEKVPSVADILIAKANDVSVTDYSLGDMGEMYTFEHDEATQTTGWSEAERRDYRYIGANPNNWIKFNGEDWRIIGVFTTEVKTGEDTSGNPIYEKKQLIKIIRNESIENIPWDDYADDSVTNEWTTASLKTLLNGDYYNTGSGFNGTYVDGAGGNNRLIISKGLDETARSQIEEVKWYLGGLNTAQNLGGPAYYSFERGEKTCATETTYCSDERSTNTLAKVGLMYPSDYIYTYANGVDNTCYTDGYNCNKGTPTNGWLYNSSLDQWTISPDAGNSNVAFRVLSSGCVSNYRNYVYSTYAVRPSLYLASDIKIVSGDGASSETAYQIG